MIDKISEKIDYMFRKSKNADERCFDFFLRSITFFIILLVVLFYGSFVHADDGASNDMITLSSAGLQTDIFVSSELIDWLSSEGYETSDFSTIGIVSGLSSYPFSTDALSGLLIPSYITYGGNTYNPEDYHIFLGQGNFSSGGINYLNVYIVVGQDIVVGNGGTTVYSFTSESFGIFKCAVNPSTLVPYIGYPYYNSGDNFRSSGTNSFDSNITFTYFNIPSPIYYGNQELYTVLLDDTLDSNIRSDFTYQYVHYPDNIFQINYHYALDHPSDPEQLVESDENNLYLDQVQIGLTSVNNNQDLLSSEVAIGVSTEDDYILNHLDNFELNIDFKFHIKDTFVSSPNDPNTDYYISYPLRAFMNSPVTISILEIMRNSTFPSGSTYSNFYQYYTDLLNQNNYHVVSEGTFRGLLPIITSKAYEILFGNFHIVNPSLPNYTIFDFNLEVTCWLTSVNTPEESGNYSKKFDFLNGSESVTAAGLLQNYNPWEGTQEPSASPIIPSNGSSITGYSGGGNTNVSVNVSGQKVPIGVKTRAEIETILNNYKAVNDSFMDQWQDLSEPNNNNNFIKYLNQETRQLPAVDYMIAGACCVFGLSILLFVLKVLLF